LIFKIIVVSFSILIFSFVLKTIVVLFDSKSDKIYQSFFMIILLTFLLYLLYIIFYLQLLFSSLN